MGRAGCTAMMMSLKIFMFVMMMMRKAMWMILYGGDDNPSRNIEIGVADASMQDIRSADLFWRAFVSHSYYHPVMHSVFSEPLDRRRHRRSCCTD